LLKVDVKDVNLRLNSVPPPAGSTSTKLSLSSSQNAPTVILRQLVTVRDLIDQSLDVVDVSTYTGDPLNASFIYGQLRLLRENLSEARLALKGEGEETKGKWWEDSVEESVSSNPSHHLYPGWTVPDGYDASHLTLHYLRIFPSIFRSPMPLWYYIYELLSQIHRPVLPPPFSPPKYL
jgi:hypothetical protein